MTVIGLRPDPPTQKGPQMAPRKHDEPIFRNPKVIIFAEINVDEGSKCVFTPWMNKQFNVVGWDAQPADIKGHVYLYVAPDLNAESPQFYLYVGPHGDPRKDRRLGPYNLKGDET